MTTTFRTVVVYLPPTPLGLLPRAWKVEHRCMLCWNTVASDALIRHAQAHSAGAPGPNDDVP